MLILKKYITIGIEVHTTVAALDGPGNNVMFSQAQRTHIENVMLSKKSRNYDRFIYD